MMLGLPGGCNATRAARDVTGSVCHRPKTFSLLRAPQSQHGSIKILNYPKTFPFFSVLANEMCWRRGCCGESFSQIHFPSESSFPALTNTDVLSMFSHRPCWCLVFPFDTYRWAFSILPKLQLLLVRSRPWRALDTRQMRKEKMMKALFDCVKDSAPTTISSWMDWGADDESQTDDGAFWARWRNGWRTFVLSIGDINGDDFNQLISLQLAKV